MELISDNQLMTYSKAKLTMRTDEFAYSKWLVHGKDQGQ